MTYEYDKLSSKRLCKINNHTVLKFNKVSHFEKKFSHLSLNYKIKTLTPHQKKNLISTELKKYLKQKFKIFRVAGRGSDASILSKETVTKFDLLKNERNYFRRLYPIQ